MNESLEITQNIYNLFYYVDLNPYHPSSVADYMQNGLEYKPFVYLRPQRT